MAVSFAVAWIFNLQIMCDISFVLFPGLSRSQLDFYVEYSLISKVTTMFSI